LRLEDVCICGILIIYYFTIMFRKTILILGTVFVGAGFLLSTNSVYAAPDYAKIKDEGFHAQYISQSVSDPVAVEAGETISVVFRFKNIGTKTWDSNSTHFVSAYTMNPRYRTSDFRADNWLDYRQTAKIPGVVRPGEVGELTVQFKAPEKVGTYKEEFWLASDGWSWVKGGYFFAEINVIAKQEVGTAPDVVEQPTQIENSEEIQTNSLYQAKKIMQSKKEISAAGGERVKLVIGYQNVGAQVWDTYAFVVSDETSLAASGDIVSFVDESWKDNITIIQVDEPVPQWEAARGKFYVKMPSQKGSYTLTLVLQVAGEKLEDTVLHIPVNVTDSAPSYFSNSQTSESVDRPRLEQEPTIRVGVWREPEQGVEFISHDDTYIVYAGTERKGTLPPGMRASMFFGGGTYHFQSDGLNFMSTQYIRLEPEYNKHAVFTLPNYERKVSWKGPQNFNAYRGVAEYRRTQDDAIMYLINELPFEDYVAGIAETSNASPIEYIKALLTAARTYAYYVQQTTKHDARNFDVVAHTGDQLYLGYESEKLMPRVKEAQEATRGYMITYDTDKNFDTQNDIVITPYYANSDGRTRSWTEVWGGSAKPWLVSVPAKYDARDGKSMYGHGVGMSARDAAYKAEEEKIDYQTILKYYYTGVGVERIY